MIGYMGDTGDAKGTPFHLHFEMHPDGGWAVPPIAYVSAWEQATPGVGSAVPAPALTTPQTPVAPPSTTPEGAELESVSDISQASGLDEVALGAVGRRRCRGIGPAARARRHRRGRGREPARLRRTYRLSRGGAVEARNAGITGTSMRPASRRARASTIAPAMPSPTPVRHVIGGAT